MQSKRWIRGKVNLAALVVTAPFVLDACGCDPTACIEGLMVQFTTAPAAPIQVELLVGGQVLGEPVSPYCGAPTGCNQFVFFKNAVPKLVTVRLKTTAGTRLIENVQPRYKKGRPNRACGSDCLYGTINVPLP